MSPVERHSPTAPTYRATRQISVALMIGLMLFSSACSAIERRPIRLSPTATAEPGIRVLVDNCPGPASVALSIRDEVVWSIERVDQSQDGDEESPIDEVDAGSTAEQGDSGAGSQGLVEFIVGQTPPGWTEAVPLESGLRGDTRYTISARPDDVSIDFSLGDLAPGLLFDGVGRSQFNQDLISAPCEQPADAGAFIRNVFVLLALGVTTAALVLVGLIAILFVVTRRFSRIRQANGPIGAGRGRSAP